MVRCTGVMLVGAFIMAAPISAFVALPIFSGPELQQRSGTVVGGRSVAALAWRSSSRDADASSSASACAAAFGSALTLASLVLKRRLGCAKTARGRVTRNAGHAWERKWHSIEETREPTTLPMWQRDFRYGYGVLIKTMMESRKAGKKVFWECRVLESVRDGCRLEMMISGIGAWCPIGMEGSTRLSVGDIVQFECVAAPLARVDKEPKHSPWPTEDKHGHSQPVMSHWHWLEQQKSIEKAKDLKTGDIVEGIVYKHIPKGLLINLDPNDVEGGAKGMLCMTDISRKMSSHLYVKKMFPEGTKMKCYVVHSDSKNGRITLSTKEFEDDDHMGWMLSFPERCMARGEAGAARYHDKRDAYIAWLQK